MKSRQVLRRMWEEIESRVGYLSKARQGAGVPAIYDEEARALREVLGGLRALEEALTEDMVTATPLRVPAMLERLDRLENQVRDLERHEHYDEDDDYCVDDYDEGDDEEPEFDPDFDLPDNEPASIFPAGSTAGLPEGNEAQRAREILAKRKAAVEPIDDRDPTQLHETIDGLRHRIRDLEAQRDMLSGKVQRLTNPGRESHDFTTPSK